MIHASTSSWVIGKAKGVKYGAHCFGVPKHRNILLRRTPRGSKPTMSNRLRTSGVKQKGAAKHTKSPPDPPGPHGFVHNDPCDRAGPAARRRTIAIEIWAPFGSSWSSGTPTLAHWNGPKSRKQALQLTLPFGAADA